MAVLKLSTTYTRMFKMISSTDHFTLKTGASPTVNLSKAGAAFGAAAGTVTEVASGWYKVALTAADTGTLGDLVFYITGSGADDTDFCDQVTANILGDTLPANTTQLAGQTVTAAAGVTFPTSVASPTNITAGTITTVTTVTNQLTAAQIATGVWQDAVAGDFTTASSIGKSLYTSGVVPGGTNGLFIAGTNAATTITTGLTAHLIGTVDTCTTVTNQLTAGAIATGVWTDTTAGDFTTALSVGKSLMNGVALGTGLTVANLTNAPTAGDLTATMKTSVTTAATAATPVAASVSGNVVGSVGSVASGGIAAASLATAAKQDIADYVLDRNMTTGTDSGTDSTSVRTPRQALRVLRNKTSIAAGVATITKEDDATASWTATITTTAGNPISTVDPT